MRAEFIELIRDSVKHSPKLVLFKFFNVLLGERLKFPVLHPVYRSHRVDPSLFYEERTHILHGIHRSVL